MEIQVSASSFGAGSGAWVPGRGSCKGKNSVLSLSFGSVMLRKPWRLVLECSYGPAGEKNYPTGQLLETLREVQSQGPLDRKKSLARQGYDASCESAVNNQINVEYNGSYSYHSMSAYFDRDNLALPGFAKCFKEASEKERKQAEKLMKYQNKRGGNVTLYKISSPATEFRDKEKGDALHAMELALAMEKKTMEKLYELQKVAEEANDVQLSDYIESEFLAQQVEDIKKVSEYVAELRRIGKSGHGIYYFDRVLGGGV